MIYVSNVTDRPKIFGARRSMLQNSTFFLPRGRYALLSTEPHMRKPLIDLMAGLRPPSEGTVLRLDTASWPIGRQGFTRGKATGLELIRLVCGLYGLDRSAACAMVSEIMTNPNYLEDRVEHWPLAVRYEFSYSLALIPSFGIYFVEGSLPFEVSRFTRLWQSLFEERLARRALVLSTYRPNQMLDYCLKALVYDRGQLRVEDDLEAAIEKYPVRQAGNEFVGDGGRGEPSDGLGDDSGFF